jgi:hypothetical protein
VVVRLSCISLLPTLSLLHNNLTSLHGVVHFIAFQVPVNSTGYVWASFNGKFGTELVPGHPLLTASPFLSFDMRRCCIHRAGASQQQRPRVGFI